MGLLYKPKIEVEFLSNNELRLSNSGLLVK